MLSATQEAAMEHETDLLYDIEAMEYAERPEARAETIAELRALMDQMDKQLGPDLMDGLRVQVERAIKSKDGN
jgi:hypothetical protein